MKIIIDKCYFGIYNDSSFADMVSKLVPSQLGQLVMITTPAFLVKTFPQDLHARNSLNVVMKLLEYHFN